MKTSLPQHEPLRGKLMPVLRRGTGGMMGGGVYGGAGGGVGGGGGGFGGVNPSTTHVVTAPPPSYLVNGFAVVPAVVEHGWNI